MSYAKNFLKMDKIDRLLDAMEHPENYSRTEVEEMLRNPEVREVFVLLDKTKSSLQTITTPDTDSEWKRFEEKHLDFGKPQKNWLTSIFSRNAAASIAIAITSFTAVAAVVGAGIHQISENRGTTVKEMDAVSETASDTTVTLEEGDIKAAEIVVFDNDPLETILNCIAGYYECKVAFGNEASKSLRLYFRWNQALTVEEAVERLNNFEQINLSVKDNTIKAD